MGFWHTGYMEFHEPSGFGGPVVPLPPKHQCPQCGEVFESAADLSSHRFEAHPRPRPRMYVSGRELGAHPIRITRPLAPTDVEVQLCDQARLNGTLVPVSRLPSALASVTADVCRIVLSRAGVEATFELDVRIASDADLAGVEDEFRRVARGRRLDTRAIKDFIDAARRYDTAAGYYDGICAYLYGVLAKERSADSTLPYDQYIHKFSAAAEQLAAYDRPLARIIACLIEFHFNHFGDAARLWPGSRVGRVARRFADWLTSLHPEKQPAPAEASLSQLETLVTDLDSEQIVRWAGRPLSALATEAGAIEAFLRRGLAAYDEAKVHVLLGQIHAARGARAEAAEHAKALRNLPRFEGWADALIRRSADDHA